MPNVENKDKKEAVFQRYIDILHTYGKFARNIEKKIIYEEVGIPLFIKPQMVGIIIRKMLKDKTRREILENDENLKYVLEELDKIALDRKKQLSQ